MKTSAIYAALSSLALVTSVYAQKSTIEGTAVNAQGQPAANAEVRIQQDSAKGANVSAKTDGKGHFVAAGLPVGAYNIAVMVGGKVISSAAHVKTQSGQTVRLQLGIKTATVQTAAPAQKKHWVYVNPPTGSHMGGYQQEGQPADARYNTQNVDRLNPDQLQRMSTRTSLGGGN